MDRMTTRNRGAYTPKPRPTRSITARAARGVLSFSPVPDLGIATALGVPTVPSEGEDDDLGEQVAIDRKTNLEAAKALSAMRDVNDDGTETKKASSRATHKTKKAMRKPTGDERFVDDASDGEDPDDHHVPDGASAVEYLRASAADRDIRASARKARPGNEDYLKAAAEFEHTRERMQTGANHSADSAEYDSTTSSAIWATKPTRSEASEYLTKNGAAWLGLMIAPSSHLSEDHRGFSSMTLLSLPTAILEHTLGFCDARSLEAAMLSCKPLSQCLKIAAQLMAARLGVPLNVTGKGMLQRLKVLEHDVHRAPWLIMRCLEETDERSSRESTDKVLQLCDEVVALHVRKISLMLKPFPLALPQLVSGLRLAAKLAGVPECVATLTPRVVALLSPANGPPLGGPISKLCITCLGKYDIDEHEELIVPFLARESERKAAMHALCMAVSTAHHVVERLHDGAMEVRVRVDAMEALSAVSATMVAHAHEMLPLLTDQSWRVRTEAIKAFARHPAPMHTHAPAVASLLHDWHRQVRIEAVRALGSFGQTLRAHAASVVALLRDADVKIRSEAVRALGNDVDTLRVHSAVLVPLLDDPCGEVIGKAVDALTNDAQTVRVHATKLIELLGVTTEQRQAAVTKHLAQLAASHPAGIPYVARIAAQQQGPVGGAVLLRLLASTPSLVAEHFDAAKAIIHTNYAGLNQEYLKGLQPAQFAACAPVVVDLLQVGTYAAKAGKAPTYAEWRFKCAVQLKELPTATLVPLVPTLESIHTDDPDTRVQSVVRNVLRKAGKVVAPDAKSAQASLQKGCTCLKETCVCGAPSRSGVYKATRGQAARDAERNPYGCYVASNGGGSSSRPVGRRF